jgi:hypothetical protein
LAQRKRHRIRHETPGDRLRDTGSSSVSARQRTNDAARIAGLYSVIAVIATAANLISQALVISWYHGPYAIEMSILVGTAVGLPLKYVLEKQHIFEFTTVSLAHDGRLFLIYTLTGVATTALFWGIEYAFHVLFDSDAMRYLGGAIGLTLGYAIKYRLDKHFVFVPGRAGGFEQV